MPPTQQTNNRLFRSRDSRAGMVTFTSVVFMVLLLMLIVYTVNLNHIVSDKTELQHTADAASASAAYTQTRMMNSLTGANHAIGEMLGMVIVHHAIGDDLLDEEKTPDTEELQDANDRLDQIYEVANNLGGVTQLIAYPPVRETQGEPELVGEATLLDSKIELKKWLTFVYLNKAAGRAMQKFPPTYAAGVSLEQSMHPLEMKIYQEMKTLQALEKIARMLIGTKLAVRDQYIPAAKRYTDDLVETAPDLMLEAARQVVAQMHPDVEEDLVVELFSPDEVGLPVEIDPHATAQTQLDLPAIAPRASAGCCNCGSVRTSIDRDQVVKTSQLARATFPWVVYHRAPLLEAMELLLPLARSAHFYKDYTDGFSKKICRMMMDEKDLGLYVVKGYPAPDKGYALWTEERDEADRYFATLAVVWAPASTVVGTPATFGRHQPNGRIAVAQSLLYNANPWRPHAQRIDLTCKRITPNRQPVFGQDTLNWEAPVWELIAKTDQGPAPAPEFPKIKLNWQTKLTPTSSFAYDEMRARFDEFDDEQLRDTVEQLLEETPAALVAH